MANYKEVTVEKLDNGKGYRIYAASDFIDGNPKIRDTSFPTTFYEAREIVEEHGVLPKMINLNPEEEREIKSGIGRLNQSFDVI